MEDIYSRLMQDIRFEEGPTRLIPDDVLDELKSIFKVTDGQGIPVLTYEEVAGLVMGYDPWEFGLQYHNVQSIPLLRKMGIKADPVRRFLAKDGTRLPEPANLING